MTPFNRDTAKVFAAIGVLVVAPLAPGAASAGGAKWSNYYGLTSPGANGLAVVDINGNGSNEIVFAGSANSYLSSYYSQPYVAYMSRAGDTWQVDRVRTFAAGSSLLGKIQVIAAGNGRDVRIVAAERSAAYEHRLVTFEGSSLLPVASSPISAMEILSGVDDIDADGDLEAYGVQQSYDSNPLVFDLDTGALEWDGSGFQASRISAAQLDDDPALELILGSNSVYDTPTGHIVDGATYLSEWSYLDGFYGLTTAVGNFLESAEGLEFVTVSYSGLSRLFVSSPFYSPISEFQLGNYEHMLVADVDHDGFDELITAQSFYGLSVYSPRLDSVLFQLDNLFQATYDIADFVAGEIDSTSGMDILWSSLSGYGEFPNQLLLLNYGAANTQLIKDFQAGPYTNLAVGRFSGGSSTEVAVSRRIESMGIGSSSPRILLLGSTSGSELGTISSGLGDLYDSYARASLASINLDDDAQPELLVAAHTGYETLEVAAFRNGTFPAMWETQLTSPYYERPRERMAEIPRNGSASDVAVLAAGRLFVLSGSTGQVLWKSTSFQVEDTQSLMITDMDGDSMPEAVLGVGTRIHVIDLQSHLLEQSVQLDFTAIGQAVEFDGGNCVHVIFGTAQLMRRACNGAEISRRDFPSETAFVRMLDDSYGPLVLADDQHLWIDTPGLEDRILGTDLGIGLGEANKGELRISGRRAQLYIGSALGVFKFDFGVDTIFEDGLEN